MTLVKIGNVYIDEENQLTSMLYHDLELMGYTIVREANSSNFDIAYDIEKFNQHNKEEINNERNSEYNDNSVCSEDN